LSVARAFLCVESRLPIISPAGAPAASQTAMICRSCNVISVTLPGGTSRAEAPPRRCFDQRGVADGFCSGIVEPNGPFGAARNAQPTPARPRDTCWQRGEDDVLHLRRISTVVGPAPVFTGGPAIRQTARPRSSRQPRTAQVSTTDCPCPRGAMFVEVADHRADRQHDRDDCPVCSAWRKKQGGSGCSAIRKMTGSVRIVVVDGSRLAELAPSADRARRRTAGPRRSSSGTE